MRLTAILLVVAVCGCSTVPWPEPPAVSTAGWNAAELPARFESQLAPRFEMMQSVVFRFGRMEMAGIGVVSVDRPARSFQLVCLTPLGVKLFEVAGRGDRTECRFALGGFGPGDEVARAVADDVRRAYFDLAPSASAAATRRRHELAFAEPVNGGVLEHIFAGAAQRLAAKRFREGRRVVWSIQYGPYLEERGESTPANVHLRNLRYGYTLTVRPMPDRREKP